MTQAPRKSSTHTPPKHGDKAIKAARTSFIAVRCTADEHALITEAASRAGLSVGAFLRILAFGSAGPRSVRRPPVERRELARLTGLVGKMGSNINQLAHGYNRAGALPGFAEILAMRREIGEMRAALMTALGRIGE